MKKRPKRTPKKEEIAEDWCFVCKDGGLLLVCDYKECLKAYHPDCVEKDDSFLETGNRWTCGLHSCYICHKTPNCQCYCCPKAVCGRCIKTVEFVHVRGRKGFCTHCLKLAILVEEKKDVDSDGDKVDFKDRETYEGLFREYWEIINVTESLTLENLISANARLKIGKNFESSDEFDSSEEYQAMSDYDDKDDVEAHKREKKRKRSKGQLSWMKGKEKSNKKEFIGWGSKSLIQFLTSIGKDTTEELSQREVSNIINGYIKENKLLDSQKKRKILCDERLESVFGRKIVNKHRVYDLLETHFDENQEQSEEDELGYNLEDNDDDILVACKRKKKAGADKISQKKEVIFNISRCYFASIIPENIKLVYLKRSLVEKLSQQPETFESKVIGSFVRVKADPNDCFRKNSYQLVQVTGITSHTVGGNDQKIFLQVSDMPEDICISVLSDDDFSEEECQDLRNKVKGGVLKKLTVVDLEQKARSLHEDIIKHWIPRELSLLQNRIDQANEKGWRRELFEYLGRRELLQNPTEQSRLLQKVPTVIPDIEEVGPVYEDSEDDKKGDKGSPNSILTGTWKGNKTSSDVPVINETSSTEDIINGSVKDGDGNGKAINSDTSPKFTKEKRELRGHASSPEERILLSETSANEEKQSKCPHILASEDQLHRYTSCLTSVKKEQPTYVEQGTVKSQVLIDLSCDDDENNKSSVAIGKQKLEDPESSVWRLLGPNGERKGPCSLSFLKVWGEETPYALKLKVWKTDQSEEHAIPLADAVGMAFPRK